MKKALALIKTFILVTLIGTLGHMAFYFVNESIIKDEGESPFFQMLWNALRLDVAVAGYVCFVPALILIVSVWWNRKALVYIWRTYFGIISLALAMATLANIVLYGYWGFPLDSTPLFYLCTSPGDAMASVDTLDLFLGFAALVVITLFIYYIIEKLVHPRRALQGKSRRHGSQPVPRRPLKVKIGRTAALILLTALLVIPVRGGLSVATNNVGSVFFSSNFRLNHCAVNPVFSFLYSVTHDEDFASKYRFMDDKEATERFQKMVYTKQRNLNSADTTAMSVPLSPDFINALEAGKTGEGQGVNVVMVIMESFSSYIMSEKGNVKGVTNTIDALSNQGVYFTNFYANSFRTDRGLVAILSGYPAQPTSSLMKYPHKTNNLYGIARSLNNVGFATHYIYGGDANFTNMRAYLHATGFETIVSEEDYDSSIPKSKWGVDDSYLFQRAIKEMTAQKQSGNRLFVVQTSSSHEPYEVPVDKYKDKALNAFYFADKCLGDYIADLKRQNLWDNTLLLIVPDHLGCYPAKINNFQLYRYQIPLILSGGAITKPVRIPVIGSQQDIPATLLTLLGVKHSEYKFSKDLLDANAPHFAFFTVPDAVGMVTEDNQVIYDNEQKKTVLDQGPAKGKNLRNAQAYLQKLYDDIDQLK